MTRKIQYPASATINPRDLKNTSLKDARDIEFLDNLESTSLNETLIDYKTVTGLEAYYKPIKAVSDGGTIYLLQSNSDGDSNKNGIVLVDSYSLEVVATKFGTLSVAYVTHILVDDNYIYIAGYTAGTAAKIFKIDKFTLEILATYTSAEAATASTALCFLNQKLYFATYTGTTRYIREISKTTMAATATFSDANPTQHIKDMSGKLTTLYCAVDTSPGQVLKMNVSTMTISATWTGAAGENKTVCIEADSNNVFVIVSDTSIYAIKINTSDMTTLYSYLMSNNPVANTANLAQSKNHIRVYFKDSTIGPETRKILKSNLSIVATIFAPTATQPIGLIESKLWQHYIWLNSSNTYTIMRYATDASETTDIPATILSKIRANRGTSVQSIPATIDTKVQLNVKTIDTEGEMDITTNYRYTAKQAGYYQVNASIQYTSAEVGKLYNCSVRKNGTAIMYGQQQASVVDTMIVNASDIVYLAAGDYLESWAYHTSVAAKDVAATSSVTFMSIFRIPDNI